MRFTVVESEREGGRRCSAGARPRHAPGRSKWEAFAEGLPHRGFNCARGVEKRRAMPGRQG